VTALPRPIGADGSLPEPINDFSCSRNPAKKAKIGGPDWQGETERQSAKRAFLI